MRSRLRPCAALIAACPTAARRSELGWTTANAAQKKRRTTRPLALERGSHGTCSMCQYSVRVVITRQNACDLRDDQVSGRRKKLTPSGRDAHAPMVGASNGLGEQRDPSTIARRWVGRDKRSTTPEFVLPSRRTLLGRGVHETAARACHECHGGPPQRGSLFSVSCAASTGQCTHWRCIRALQIYTFEAKHNVFALNWANRQEHAHWLAVGSFVEDYTKYVAVLAASGEVKCACQEGHGGAARD